MSKVKQLETYLENVSKIKKLKDEISLIEVELEVVDKKIETAEQVEEQLPAVKDYIDDLATKYNNLNKKRIELSLQKNKLEKDLLMFEYDSQNEK